jgi:hypothetical protein
MFSAGKCEEKGIVAPGGITLNGDAEKGNYDQGTVLQQLSRTDPS